MTRITWVGLVAVALALALPAAAEETKPADATKGRQAASAQAGPRFIDQDGDGICDHWQAGGRRQDDGSPVRGQGRGWCRRGANEDGRGRCARFGGRGSGRGGQGQGRGWRCAQGQGPGPGQGRGPRFVDKNGDGICDRLEARKNTGR
jgi:hypothetical protein